MLSFGGFCKQIKMRKDIYPASKRDTLKIYLSYIEKKHCIYNYEFLLCNKLSESHGEVAHLVGFLMLLYDIYNIKR